MLSLKTLIQGSTEHIQKGTGEIKEWNFLGILPDAFYSYNTRIKLTQQ
jgi:hypothetical protein